MAGSIDLGQVVGAPGAGIPTGGNDGQVLVKNGSANYSGRWENRPKTVNYIEPDPDGNIPINVVNYANQLVADDAQQSTGEFILRTTGGDASIADGDAWLMVLKGRSIHTGYVPESLEMTVTPAARGEGEYDITATIDRDIFVAAVSGSTTITLTYSSSWSADPATYGVTVSGTPVSGDEIEIVYVAEDRGTITQATPSSFVSTGWNLYDHTNTYAKVTKYSDTYGFLVGGTYTALQYSATLAGEKTSITVTGGSFQIPGDGYVWVTGGDSTTTYIMMTWSDWTSGYEGSWKAYTESEIDLSTIMTNFPYGLMQAGTVTDEIDLNTMTATSRIERQSYTAENIAAAKASGRQFDYDTNYIYIEKASATVYDITLDGSYTACDHGIEFFVGTDVEVYIETLYGQNLKDKLRTDVLTKSSDLVDNLTTSDATKALSAKQGKALNDNLTTANTKINHIDTRVSLILGADATSTTQSFSTYNGRKFSDYRMLVFYLFNSNSDKSQIRNCIMLPRSAWTSGKNLFLLQNHGVNMANISGIMFTYDSDTSIKAVLQGNGSLTGFAIEAYTNI